MNDLFADVIEPLVPVPPHIQVPFSPGPVCHLLPHLLRTKPVCFPPAISHPVILIVSHHFPIVFPMLVVTSPSLLLCLLSLPVSCPATTRSIALTFPSHSSPWFPVYSDPFPIASPAFPNLDRVSLEHIQEPYLYPNLQAILQLWSTIGLFSRHLSHYGWEQERGWRKFDITIGVPLDIKRTASVRWEDTTHEARLQNPPPPPTPFPQRLIWRVPEL